MRSTTSAGTTTEFLYDGDALVGEYVGGALVRRYVHGAGVDEPLVWYEGAALTDRRWLIADHQGSVIASTDAAGTTTRHAYGPYGEPDAWTGPRFRYTGQLALPEVGLYYYKARVYDPALGRFLQTDPVGYEDDLNLYAYVRNDPMNLLDPAGEATCAWGGRNDSGFSESQCRDLIARADEAISQLDSAIGQLRSLSDALESGGELNDAQLQTLTAFEEVYGSGSATAENVANIAGVATRAREFLASPNVYFRRGDLSARNWGADVRGNAASGRINIHGGYYYRGDRVTSAAERRGTLIHESGHPAGLPGRLEYTRANGLRPVGAAGINAHRARYGTARALLLADAFRCAVDPGSGDCP